MRALVIALMCLMAAPVAAAECSVESEVISWMKLEWWGATVERYDAAEAVAIANGITNVSGTTVRPDAAFVVFRHPNGEFVRVTLFEDGCYRGRIDVPTGMLASWLSRSRS